MKASVFFQAVLGLLAHIMVESHVSVPIDYDAVLFPGDRLQRWYQPRENHYKFERTFTIGRDHSYDQYSSLKLFWPEGTSPYYNRNRITYFKCINLTPTTAKASVYTIRGGTGTLELQVDVVDAPVRYRLMNRIIITCHIYTERKDDGTYRQKVPWNWFNIKRRNNQIKPAVPQSKMANSTLFRMVSFLGTTNSVQRISTVAFKTTTRRTIRKKTGKPANQGPEMDARTPGTTKSGNDADEKKVNSKGTTKKINKWTTDIEKTTRKTGTTIPPGEGIRLTTKPMPKKVGKANSSIGKTTPGITSPKTVEVTWKKTVTTGKPSQADRMTEIDLSVSPKPETTILNTTSSRTVEVTSQKSETSQVIDKITEDSTVTLSAEISLGTNYTNGWKPKINSEDLKPERMKKTNVSREKVPSPETVELTTIKSTSQRLNDHRVMTKGKKKTGTSSTGNTTPGITSPKTVEVTWKKRVTTGKHSQDDRMTEIDLSVSPKPETTILNTTSSRTVEVTSQKSETSPVINKITKDRTVTLCAEISLGTNYTNGWNPKINSEDLKPERMKKTNVSREKVPSPETVELTTIKSTSQRLDEHRVMTKDKKKTGTSSTGKTTPGITSPKTVEVTWKKRVTTGKHSQADRMTEIDLSNERASPKPETTILNATSSRTVEVTSQKSEASPVIDKITEVRTVTLCAEVSLGTNHTNGSNLKHNSEDLKPERMKKTNVSREKVPSPETVELTTIKSTSQRLDEERVMTEGKQSSKTEDTIPRRLSALYNLVLKTMRSKQKIGLAKISYQ